MSDREIFVKAFILTIFFLFCLAYYILIFQENLKLKKKIELIITCFPFGYWLLLFKRKYNELED